MSSCWNHGKFHLAEVVVDNSRSQADTLELRHGLIEMILVRELPSKVLPSKEIEVSSLDDSVAYEEDKNTAYS